MCPCFIKISLFEILLLFLPLLLAQCWAKQNFNEYSDYSDQINYKKNDHSNQPSNYRDSQTHYGAFEEEAQQQPYSKEEEAFYAIKHPGFYQSHLDKISNVSERESYILVPRMGLVRGHNKYKIIKGRQISAYFGIKYGSIQPGLGRFQKALAVELKENVVDATTPPPNCPQFPDLMTVKERESRFENVDDCLTLNIFFPAKPGSYPVLVFVHGEMLFDGSAAEGQPDYFLENDIVLVTINYRLAPFGYLSTLTDDMPGNVALSDIQMALEWIQQFIKSFNGNPNQVTIMGQSSGATLVHALSLSGQADALYHKIILQSGTALNPYFLDENPLSSLHSFAHYASCSPSVTIEDIAACLQHMSTSDLLNYFKGYFENNEPRGLQFHNGFKLIIGDKLGYLPNHPASLVSNYTKPLIVGVTKDAGAFILTRFYDQLVQLHSRNISDYIKVVLKHTTAPRHYMLWNQWALKHIFTTEDTRNTSVSNLVQKLLELINLILYRGPIIDSLRYAYKNHSIYMYCFDYRGEYHRFGHLANPLPFEIDATLSDENVYLFPYPDEVSQLNPEDKSMAKTIVTMWVNFVIHGVPDFNTSLWPKVSSEYGPFIRFTNVKNTKLELDYHFGEGIPIPHLYPEYLGATVASDASNKSTISPGSYTASPRPYYYPRQIQHQVQYANGNAN